jgi:hypothetical protein
VGVTQLTGASQPRAGRSRRAGLHGGRLVALGTPEETVTPQNLRLHHGVDLAVAFPQA